MESRIQNVVEKKKSGKYNCAQAVACTYCDIAGMDDETIRNVTNAFGVGMGNLEGTCGSLVGAGVVIGLKTKDRAKSMKIMKGIMNRFQERNHTTICKCLKEKEQFRHCNDCVADSAEFLEDALKELEP